MFRDYCAQTRLAQRTEALYSNRSEYIYDNTSFVKSAVCSNLAPGDGHCSQSLLIVPLHCHSSIHTTLILISDCLSFQQQFQFIQRNTVYGKGL